MYACSEIEWFFIETRMHTHSLTHSHTDSLDYRFTSSPSSFAPSTAPSQRSCHVIEIIDDDLLESSEQFSVQLSNNNVSRVSVVTEVMLVTIEDNDLVIVGLNRTEFLVLEEQVGGANITVCTVLRGKLQKNVTVVLTTESSSADCKCCNSSKYRYIGTRRYVLMPPPPPKLHWNTVNKPSTVAIPRMFS